MPRPAPTTINSLARRKGERSYREVAEELGYDLSAIGFLNDLLKKRITPSLEKENELRGRLELPPITESGYLVRKRKIERPYVTVSQTERKEELGVDWNTVIMCGLLTLEKMKRDSEDPDWDEGDEPKISQMSYPPVYL